MLLLTGELILNNFNELKFSRELLTVKTVIGTVIILDFTYFSRMN